VKGVPDDSVKVGIIGGSGLYKMEGLQDIREIKVRTPFGEPSDNIMVGRLGEVGLAFLPRHGHGHRIMPTEINYRANIFALKSVGVERIISVSACGSLKEELRPRDIVIVDQFFDRTTKRISTFFGDGIVAHLGFADPVCPDMAAALVKHARLLNLPVHQGGTYVCIEGPEFSTKAESQVWRSLGFSVIGMTNLPEARLAREAEICYATIALVTDYDVWKEEEKVSVEVVVGNMKANIENAKKLIKAVVPELAVQRNCECADALKGAIQTEPAKINRSTVRRLGILVNKYLK